MPTKRRIRFLPRAAVRMIPNLDDYTAQEYRATWTTAEESEASKDHLIDTVRQIRDDSSFEDNDDYSSRGLEGLISSQARIDKKKRRADVIDAVMDEQDRQWSDKLLYDEERIANASLQVTNVSRLMASATAAQDSAYVRKIVVPEFRSHQICGAVLWCSLWCSCATCVILWCSRRGSDQACSRLRVNTCSCRRRFAAFAAKIQQIPHHMRDRA